MNLQWPSGDWTEIKSWLDQALDLAPEQRADFIANSKIRDELRVEVMQMLNILSQDQRLAQNDAWQYLQKLQTKSAQTIFSADDLIGPYRIVQLLGSGGLGEVYLAERTDGGFSQQVALKVIRESLGPQHRHQSFDRERNILAQLNHPLIVPLLDGGITAHGLPWFTMPFLQGQSIIVHCDAMRKTVSDRVKLFRLLAQAVSAAHRALVIHCDIKPSNVLMDEQGLPKLLDFGVAHKLTHAHEYVATCTRGYSPAYAAPEQVLNQPLSTATDVYGLGVLLNELLCGRRPYGRAERGEASHEESIVQDVMDPLGDHRCMNEVIAKNRSSNPHALTRQLQGDLHRVVMRALAKRPEDRYSSVDALITDLDAYLTGRALPSGGTTWYRFAKFSRRHWKSLAASSLFVLFLLFATAFSWWQAKVAQQEREVARIEANRQDVLRQHFATVISQLGSSGQVIHADQVYRLLADGIEARYGRDAALHRAVLLAIGEMAFELGNIDQVPDMLKQLDLLMDNAPASDRATALLLHAYNESVRGELDLGLAHAENGLSVLDHELPGPRNLRAQLLDARATLLYQKGDREQGIASQRDALSVIESASDAGVIDHADIVGSLGNLLLNHGDLTEAYQMQQKALTIMQQGQVTGPMLDGATSNLARTRFVLGYMQEAGLAMRAQVPTDRVPQNANEAEALRNYALFQSFMGQHTQALINMQYVRESFRRDFGEHSLQYARVLIQSVRIAADNGQFEQAEQWSQLATTILDANPVQGTRSLLDRASYYLQFMKRRDSASLEALVQQIGNSGESAQRPGIMRDLLFVVANARLAKLPTHALEAIRLTSQMQPVDFPTDGVDARALRLWRHQENHLTPAQIKIEFNDLKQEIGAKHIWVQALEGFLNCKSDGCQQH